MYITFCQVWLPFMILPLYTVLDRMPDSLLEAASDLGAQLVADVPPRRPAAVAARICWPAA